MLCGSDAGVTAGVGVTTGGAGVATRVVIIPDDGVAVGVCTGPSTHARGATARPAGVSVDLGVANVDAVPTTVTPATGVRKARAGPGAGVRGVVVPRGVAVHRTPAAVGRDATGVVVPASIGNAPAPAPAPALAAAATPAWPTVSSAEK